MTHLKNIAIVVLCMAGLSFQPSHYPASADMKSNGCSVNNETVLDGEVVTYEIFYNWNMVWLLAGEVTFTMTDLGEEYHLTAAGRTYTSYEWFYKVRDTVESYVNKETMMPNKTIRIVNEGKFKKYDLCNYDRQGEIAVSEMGKTKTTTDLERIDISPCTHDILSAIYLMRNLDFSGKKREEVYETEIYLDRKIYPIDIHYRGIEKRKKIKGLGRCNTMRFEPQTIVGKVFKEDKGMKVWVSNDQNKIPLLIESPVSVGSIKAVLKSADGLKYPLEF